MGWLTERTIGYLMDRFSHPWVMSVILIGFVLMLLGEVVFVLALVTVPELRLVGISTGMAGFGAAVVGMLLYAILLLADRVFGYDPTEAVDLEGMK